MKRFLLSFCVLALLASFSYGQNTNDFGSIHEAAVAGSARGIVAFLQNGVSVDLRDSEGKTPLMAASEAGMSRVIPILLSRNAGIDIVDTEGNTALHHGALKGHAKVVSELLRNNADVTIKNRKAQTARDLATASGNTRLVNIFPSEGMILDNSFQYESAVVQTGPEQIYAILEDVNGIRARLNSDPNLQSQMKTVFKLLEAEENKWTSRKRRIATSFYSALRKEVDVEIVFIQSIAKGEDANDVVHELDVVQSTWKSVFSRASRKMREATRANSQGMQAMTRSSRGRSRRGQTGDSRTMRRPSRTGEEDAVEQIDPHASYIDSWGSISDTSLDTLYGETQSKYFGDIWRVRSIAQKLGKPRTLNAIDGVMMERKLRGERSLVVYALTKEELSNVPDTSSSENSMRGRRGRGRSSQSQQTTRRRR